MSNLSMRTSFSERVEEEMKKRRMEKEEEKKDLKDGDEDESEKMSEEDEPKKKDEKELEEDPKKDLSDDDEGEELSEEADEEKTKASTKRHKKKKMEGETTSKVDKEVVRAMGGVNSTRLKDLGPEIEKKVGEIQAKLDELKQCKIAMEPMRWSNLQEELYQLNQQLADLKFG